MRESKSLIVNRIRDFYIDFLGYDFNIIVGKSDEELLESLTPEQLEEFVHF